VHKTGTYWLRRGGSCTGMTLSQLSAPPCELFRLRSFEQQYTQHISEKGKESSTRTEMLGRTRAAHPHNCDNC
jgi:hypothetical protein